MRNVEKNGYYQRLNKSLRNQLDTKNKEVKTLQAENKRLREMIQAKDESDAALIQKVAVLGQKYSEGILELAEAQEAYRSAAKELVDMKRRYTAEFRQAINRIRE